MDAGVNIKRSVLVVEDDAELRDQLSESLERAGYAVSVAHDGAEALAWLRGQNVPPAIILLDWMMPVMDGLAFLARIASNPTYGRVPVVVVSAIGETAAIPRLCVESVVCKPFPLRRLIDEVDRLCRRAPRKLGEAIPTVELDRLLGRYLEPHNARRSRTDSEP